MNALKPTEFKAAGFISQLCDKPLASSFAKDNHVFNYAGNLHKVSLRINGVDGVNSSLINVPQRVVLQQIAESKNAQFFFKQISF
jgi:hypothetical protein